MTLRLYAVRDIKADAFHAPFAIQTRALALRAFSEACLDARSEFAKYPDDYQLFELGEYDPNTGLIVSEKLPVWVASAAEVVLSAKAAKEKFQPRLPVADPGVAPRPGEMGEPTETA